MARSSILSFAWIAYIVLWVSWVFLIPRFIPQVNGFGFFLPIFFFFPFFRRRRGPRARPATAPSADKERGEQQEYPYENVVMSEEIAQRRFSRNRLLYFAGAAIIVLGTVLFLTHYFMQV